MLDVFGTALTTFLVTVDPLGLVPIFVALTREAGPQHRRAMARKGVLIGGATLLAFAFAGERLLTGLGIGMPAFRIAGGVFLFLLALEMVFERRTERRGGTATSLAGERPVPADVAVFPIGVPLIAGPAAITSVVLAVGRHGDELVGRVVVLAALLLTLLATWLALALAARLERVLGETLIGVLTRLLGLLLGALAVQHVVDGLREALAS